MTRRASVFVKPQSRRSMPEGVDRLRLLFRLVFLNWLGRQDSNLGMAESKSAALPLGYAPKCRGSARRPAK